MQSRDNLFPKDIGLVQDLITGDSDRYCKHNPEKRWLFDIVSNHRNSFDLDKLDYLNRDLIHTAINSSRMPTTRIIDNARVIDNQLAYNRKVHNDINTVFARRNELFRQVYLHKTCQAIELMVAEALILANSHFRFDRIVHEPERYIRTLTDELLPIIKRSKKPELQDSAKILQKIDRREIYKVAGESLIPKELKGKIKAQDILDYAEETIR